MSLVLFLAAVVLVPIGQRPVAPLVAVGVWYPATSDVETMRRDFRAIRESGFNAIMTSVSWKDGEPRRGAYNLLELDRLIAIASETGLHVQVDVLTEPPPSWKNDGSNAPPGTFYEYVRRRVGSHPTVIDVGLPGTNGPDESRRATVGGGPGALTLRQARVALWSAIAAGSRAFSFVDPKSPMSAEVLALGEIAGVVTRNPALFAPLRPRSLKPGEVTVQGGGMVAVNILESTDTIVIIAINQAAEVRKVTVTFPPDIPEAAWQNMEAGTDVHFVMGNTGPFLEHAFLPQDVVVLAIRKQR